MSERVCVCVFDLTSVAKILLIDLDHEFSVNISENAAVHPVRHKPEHREDVNLVLVKKKIFSECEEESDAEESHFKRFIVTCVITTLMKLLL